MRSLPASEAKSRLADALREVEAGGSILITRYGKPVAALVPADRLEQLERLEAAGPMAGLAGLAGRFQDGADLAEALDKLERRPGRPLPLLAADE